MGWAAVFAELALPPLLLYAGAIAWTIGYDTIYAHQDKEDDALVGVRSTARLFAENTKVWLVLFYSLFAGMALAAFWLSGVAWPGYAGLAICRRAARLADQGNRYRRRRSVPRAVQGQQPGRPDRFCRTDRSLVCMRESPAARVGQATGLVSALWGADG
jgi:heme O synthase-like polyprenyltransferase